MSNDVHYYSTSVSSTQPAPGTGRPKNEVLTSNIHQSLSALIPPGQVVELRVPGVNGKRQTDSGFFDDLAKLAQAAARYDGKAEGVYITLNPLNPALLARASNRVKTWATHTAGDSDITRCTRFLLDFDAVRPAGISSTDAEHTAALATAAACRVWLTEQGWPEPLAADSGNGAHLIYALDLPNEPATIDLLKRCLVALAERFDDAVVKVDRATFNPSRLCKLYGTHACKGDHTAERPHRQAKLLSAPTAWTPVSLDCLQALAVQAPIVEPKRIERSAASTGSSATTNHAVIDEIKARFDLLAYAQQHFPGGVKAESNGQVRLLGNGGLLLKPEAGIWNHFQNGMGGDALDLVGYVLFSTGWNRHDSGMWKTAVEAAAQETGVVLPPTTTPKRDQQTENSPACLPAAPSTPPVRSQIEALQQNAMTRLITAQSMLDLPPTTWLLDQILPHNAIGFVWGESGIGKSFLMLHLALTVAQTEDVIYIASEGWNGYGERIRAWTKHYKKGLGKLYFRRELLALEQNAVQDFIAQIRSLQLAPKLIVLDTVATVMPGASDNDAKDIGLLSRYCRLLSLELGATVVGVHHPTKDGKTYRGSGALRANFDFVLAVEADDDQMRIMCQKQKEDRMFPDQQVAFLPVDIGLPNKQGRVVVPGDLVVQTKQDPLTPLQRRLIDALVNEDSPDGMTSADLSLVLRCAESSLYSALKKLKAFSFLSQEGRGKAFVLTEAGRAAYEKGLALNQPGDSKIPNRLFFPLSASQPASAMLPTSTLSNTTGEITAILPNSTDSQATLYPPLELGHPIPSHSTPSLLSQEGGVRVGVESPLPEKKEKQPEPVAATTLLPLAEHEKPVLTAWADHTRHDPRRYIAITQVFPKLTQHIRDLLHQLQHKGYLEQQANRACYRLSDAGWQALQMRVQRIDFSTY